jgi:hypothetical protein
MCMMARCEPKRAGSTPLLLLLLLCAAFHIMPMACMCCVHVTSHVLDILHSLHSQLHQWSNTSFAAVL